MTEALLADIVFSDWDVTRIIYNSEFKVTEFRLLNSESSPVKTSRLMVDEVKKLARERANGRLKFKNIEVNAIKQEDNTYKYTINSLGNFNTYHRNRADEHTACYLYIDEEEIAPLEKKYGPSGLKIKKVYYIAKQEELDLTTAVVTKIICSVITENEDKQMYETDEIEISSREIAENIGFKRRSSFWYSSSFDCLRIDYMFAIKFCATRNYIFDRGIEFIEDIKLQEWENKMSILGKRDNYNIVLGQLFAYTGNETELLIPPVQAVHKNVFSFSKVKKIILHPDFIYMPVVKDHSEVCKKSLSFTNEYENNIIIDASRVKPLYANIENPTELQRMMMNQLVYSDNIYISSPACEF